MKQWKKVKKVKRVERNPVENEWFWLVWLLGDHQFGPSNAVTTFGDA